MALSFLLWSVAQSGWLYYEDVLGRTVPTISWINILFFFFVAPMAVALVLPPRRTEQSLWPFSLDVLQLGVVAVTAYLYFFYVPAFWHGREADLNQAIRLASELRNYVLLGGCIFRIGLSARDRATFWSMAVFFGLYCLGESLYFHVTPPAIINTGRWFDLTWSIPFAAVAIFAGRARVTDAVTDSAAAAGPWKTTLAFHLMPLLIPLVVVGMATRIVREQLLLAGISVAASFLCAAGRVFAATLSQQKAVAALLKTEDKFRALFSTNPRPSWVFDLETLAFLEVNQAAVRQYGYAREEFLSSKITDLIYPDDPRVKDFASFVKQISESSEPFFGQTMHRTKDGRWFDVALTATNVQLDGRTARLVLAEDITARKRTEDDLRRSQQMLALHIKDTPLAFIEWDFNSKIIGWNPAAEKIFGYSREEALGKDPSLLAVPGQLETTTAACAELMSKGGNNRGMNDNLTRSGCVITCNWYNTSLIDESGKVLGSASLVQDVTEQHVLQQQLLQSQKMEAVGTLAGGVAHDFNNLLTVITGYTCMLQERLQGDPRVSAELQEISAAADRAASLTRQLLTFSRKQVNQPVLTDLNECVRRMETMLRRLIGADVELVTTLAEDKCMIRVDVGQMEQVIMNLAVNAREAMPKGGRLIFATAIVPPATTSSSVSSIVLSAIDNGCGMDENVKAHIFEPFFTTKLGTGTGLGLSTVFGIVEQNGGSIEVASRVGVGTTFTLEFPQVLSEETPVVLRRHESSLIGFGTILLVEDESSVRNLARQILEECGYEVLTANSGRDATDLCLEFSRDIHLLVTDVVMPKMSGPELVQQLKATRPGLKVLFVSGYTDKALSATTSLGPGINLLQKPFSPHRLSTAVKNVLTQENGLH
jgi:PAS domain S-box-containing protein